MTYAAPMLDSYPAEIGQDMLPHLVTCIHDDLDCADIGDVTARVLSRHTGYDANVTRAQVQAAAAAARTCADSCGKHRDMREHCRLCEQACRAAEQALGQLLKHLAPSGQAPARPSQAASQTG